MSEVYEIAARLLRQWRERGAIPDAGLALELTGLYVRLRSTESVNWILCLPAGSEQDIGEIAACMNARGKEA